jgi:hypothetical protein
MNRVLSVARILVTSWLNTLGWPVIILASSFAVNLVIFTAIGDEIPYGAGFVTGGIVSIYIVEAIASGQAITQFFSFAVGLNVTRRTFYLATCLVVLAQSVVFGILLYVCALIEHATAGWGIGLPFFDAVPVTHGNSPVNIAVYAVPMALLSFIGVFIAVVWKRWGNSGFFMLSLLTIVGLGLLGALITWRGGWPAVGAWFVDQPALLLVAGWTLIPVAALAGGGYAVLRRANP